MVVLVQRISKQIFVFIETNSLIRSNYLHSLQVFLYVIYRHFPGVSEVMSYLTWSRKLPIKAECAFLPSLTLLQSWTSLTFPHLLLSAHSSRLSLAGFSPFNSSLCTYFHWSSICQSISLTVTARPSTPNAPGFCDLSVWILRSVTLAHPWEKCFH